MRVSPLGTHARTGRGWNPGSKPGWSWQLLVIHAYASQPQYWRHITPIVDELRARGHEVTTWAKRATQPWGGRIRLPAPNDVVIVASEVDARLVIPNPVVYVEHGAGQSYVGKVNLRGFPGGPGLDHVRLFITPGEHVAERWRAKYPNAAVAVVGCPALDAQSTGRRARAVPDQGIRETANEEPQVSAVDGSKSARRPIVAITSHWRCGLCPETMPVTAAWFKHGIRELVYAGTKKGFSVIGHAHPRDRTLRAMWYEIGVPFEVDPDVVLREASLLVADNTSLMYEAAALDLPVLVLNGPRYRREVEHGLRFWSHVPGIQCDDVSTFIPSVMAALDDPSEARSLRRRAARHVYAARDGRSAARAADAIERLGPRP